MSVILLVKIGVQGTKIQASNVEVPSGRFKIVVNFDIFKLGFVKQSPCPIHVCSQKPRHKRHF